MKGQGHLPNCKSTHRDIGHWTLDFGLWTTCYRGNFYEAATSLLILVSLALSTIVPVQAQQQTPPTAADDVVRISTKLVQIDAVVTDKSGNPIKDLGMP